MISYFLVDSSKFQLLFDNTNRLQTIYIEIIDDNIIEPYEFFTFTILSVTEVGSFKKPIIKNLKKIIYIEDDDCKLSNFNRFHFY